eukprot:CAMPEP_0179315038 /NCGR_PEP_ID=MMETSP0797-20121207/54833_1 /TAXON_ID=47934 /ORGANISM="Dinophysis acuminata, Strain DAEP01" /LENGTH=290 /DNA_ID=CAMNT_0021025505 /DNA_START=129 /DNA_END=998 /DNA_ORIENTATION=-
MGIQSSATRWVSTPAAASVSAVALAPWPPCGPAAAACPSSGLRHTAVYKLVAVPLEQLVRLGRAAGAVGVRQGHPRLAGQPPAAQRAALPRALALQGLQQGVEELPRLRDLVPADEVPGLPPEGLQHEPRVRGRVVGALEAAVVVEAQLRLPGSALEARGLHGGLHVDLLRGLQLHDQLVPDHLLGPEEGLDSRGVLELDPDLRLPLFHRLARLDEEGHALPAGAVDVQDHRREGGDELGLELVVDGVVVQVPRLAAAGDVLADHHVVGVDGPDGLDHGDFRVPLGVPVG